MRNELLPCPFCGGEPTLYQDETTGHWAVRCVKDTIKPTLLNSHGATAWGYSCTDPAEAIKAWNTRAERTCSLKLFLGQNETADILEGVCSKCSAFMDSQMRFCPNCGAKVVE